MNMPRRCIATADGERCWWTHVPAAVQAGSASVPLLIDMHGGGGCAMDAVHHGFKALADSIDTVQSNNAESSFIIVYPQGKDELWASSGADAAALNTASGSGGKQVSTTNDVEFLEQLVQIMVRGTPGVNGTAHGAWPAGRVDGSRVYLTGFSLGCMMSNRLAMERSSIIAGFGCQGGGLNWDSLSPLNRTLEGEKSRFGIQPTPSITTIGSADVWLSPPDFAAWVAWNGCGNVTNTSVTLETSGALLTAAQRTVASACNTPYPLATEGVNTPVLDALPVQVERLQIMQMGHHIDPRMTRIIWDFLKTYRRHEAENTLSAMSDPPQLTVYESGSGSGGGSTLGAGAVAAIVVASTCIVAAAGVWWRHRVGVTNNRSSRMAAGEQATSAASLPPMPVQAVAIGGAKSDV